MRWYRLLLWSMGIPVFFLILPFIFSEMQVHLVIEIFIFSLLALSFDLLFGYGGMIPFGHVGVFGVGAYTVAIILNYFPNASLLAVMLVAGMSGIVTGLIMGSLCIRLRGVYFALVTMAFQMVLFAIALKWRSVTNGDDGMGISRPLLDIPLVGSISLMNTYSLYFFVLMIVAMMYLACYFLLKTPFGNSIVCLRENDNRTSFLGYNVFLTKLSVFSVAGFMAGTAGALYVIFNEFVATTCLDLNMSMTVILITIIGGSGHLLGPLLGAIFYIMMQDWLSSLTRYWLIIMGAVYIVIVLYMKEGLVSLFSQEKTRFLISLVRR